MKDRWLPASLAWPKAQSADMTLNPTYEDFVDRNWNEDHMKQQECNIEGCKIYSCF